MNIYRDKSVPAVIILICNCDDFAMYTSVNFNIRPLYINVVSMVMMRTTRPYVERASLRMSISSLSRSEKRMSWTPLILNVPPLSRICVHACGYAYAGAIFL